MTKFNNIAVVCVLALLSKAAVAMPMDYTFTVIFDSGPLAGQAEDVFVTLDGVTGVGFEGFDPGTGLVAFDFNFGGTAFSITDDRNYNIGPIISLFDGALSFIEYLSSDFKAGIFYDRDPVLGFNQVDYEPAGVFDADTSTGQVLEDTFAKVPNSDVPAPGTIALFALGLIGLGLQRRKRVAHS